MVSSTYDKWLDLGLEGWANCTYRWIEYSRWSDEVKHRWQQEFCPEDSVNCSTTNWNGEVGLAGGYELGWDNFFFIMFILS